LPASNDLSLAWCHAVNLISAFQCLLPQTKLSLPETY
jgi:hypothetical protein